LQATLPRFLDMEREHGSLIRAALRQRAARQQRSGSGAPYSLFVAPRDGMSAWIAAIADRLPQGTVRLDSPIDRLQGSSDDGWLLSLKGEKDESIEVDGVIVATPAHVAAEMLAEIDPELSVSLASFSYSSSAIVSLGFRREQIAHALDGFGFVVPSTERRRIMSASFSSVKYPGRASEGQVLVRVFVGGPTVSDLPQLSDEELVSIAVSELGTLLKITGQPIMHHIVRHNPAMPRCELGHCDKVEAIELRTSQLPRLEVAGNAYHGVGIPNCIQSGEQAAERVLAELGVACTPATTV